MTPVIFGGLRLRAKTGGHRPLTPADASAKGVQGAGKNVRGRHPIRSISPT